MRHTALLFIFLIVSLAAFAQGAARTTRTTFQKIANVDAVSITIEGQPKNIEQVMENRLANATGVKRKKVKGYVAFLGARLRDVSDRVLDIYFTVEKAGSKANPSGEIIMIMALGNETFLSPDRYPQEFEQALNLLDAMPLEVRIYELELAIAQQEKDLGKAYKDYEKMGNDSVKLEQTLIETQAAIEQNIQDRGDQRVVLSEEEAKLAEFREMLNQEKRRALAPKEEEMNAKRIKKDENEEEEEDENN
ncbi:MAG: hypothetical protein AB8F95_14700 [Bacteroidia bacterium]